MNIFERLKVSHKLKLFTNKKFFYIFKEIFINIESINKDLINIFDIQSKYNKNDKEEDKILKLTERISIYWETVFLSINLTKMNYSLILDNNSHKQEFVSKIIIKYLEFYSKGILKVLFHLSSKFNITIDYLKKEYIKLCLDRIKIINEKIKQELEMKKKSKKKRRNLSIIWLNKNNSKDSFSVKNNSFSKKSIIKVSKDDKMIHSKKIKKNLKLSNSNLLCFQKNKNENKINENEINENKEYNNEDKEFKSIAEGNLPIGTLVQQFLKQTDYESLEKQSREIKYKLNNSISNIKRKNRKRNTVIGNKIKNIKYKILNEKKNIQNDNLNCLNISSYTNKKYYFPKIVKVNQKIDNRNFFFNEKINLSTRNLKSNLLMRNNSISKIYSKFFLTKEDMFYQ